MKPLADFSSALISIAFACFFLSSTGCSKNDESSSVDANQSVAIASSGIPMETRLEDLGKCALAAGDKQGINFDNYAQMLASKGIVQELQEDAQSIASKEIAFYERIAPPTNDASRIANYLNALGDIGYVLTNPPEVRLKANAYVAYYQSMLTGKECPVDQDILQLINKTKP